MLAGCSAATIFQRLAAATSSPKRACSSLEALGFALTTPLTSASTNPRFHAYRLAHQLDAYRLKTPLSVETLLETCGWKLKFSEVQKVRFRCYSRRYSLQQSALSPSTGLSTSPEKCSFAVKQAVKCSPEKCAFVGNHPGNHALVTIQKMPVFLDTCWIPAGYIAPQIWRNARESLVSLLFIK